MPFLDILEGLSPWWWVAAAFALGALEMLTGTAVLIWVALATLVMAALTALFPAMSGELQITLFAVLSIGLTFAGRWALGRFGDGGETHATLNQRSNHLIGRTAKVLDYDAGSNSGAVEIEGMRWRATWAAGQSSATGETVRIRAAKGMNLTVESTS
ncbi:NfeD family protein [Amylibacter sp. IMCC11727]|uniref:NfeD family protein n=1 Tax=Amylibacter sp. IMCC11727 TaxID=3039851 RepID=UPI00244DB35C|nr:NfeD family protein [Amylibacter sp. IMCC11727]WGI22551.1 NfeD family protein [Amylibacter sp. IMCC11727]